MTKFFETFFSRYRCGFRRFFNSQQSLLGMLEKWKRSVDKGKFLGALLSDLGKAAKTFDCLDHELLIAKVNAYRFTVPALRKKRTKIHSSYCGWLEIIFKVPQGSILGPLLFKIFLADLFFIVDDIIASYAEDNTPYVSGKDIEEIIHYLEESSKILFKSFLDNLLKSNADSSHLLVSRKARLT